MDGATCSAVEPLILIVDDEEDSRAGLREILEDEGYRVVEATNGRTALTYLTSEAPQPRLILLDIHMPEMSGPELIRILKWYYRFATIPVVTMSGYERAATNVELGEFLPKPITVESLLNTVGHYVTPPPTRP
jgi:CheY-like chemotaxis protein